MAPLRCRNYDSDGKPIGRGCSKGDACQFPHPGTAAWYKAIPYDHSRPRRGGRGGAHPSSSRRPSGSQAPPPSSRPNTDAWDTSSWGPSIPFAAGNDTSSWKDSGKTSSSTLGGASGWSEENSKDQPSSSGWGTSTSWDDAGRGSTNRWGDAGWGAASGWGDAGWGAASGWGGESREPAKTTVQGNSDASEPAVITPVVPAPAVAVPSTTPPCRELVQSVDKTATKPPTSSTTAESLSTKWQPISIPLPGRKMSQRDTSLVHSPTTPGVPAKPLAIRTNSLAAPDVLMTSVPDSADSSMRRDVPPLRAQSYLLTMRHLYSAVRLQLELDVAQEKTERWKITQASPIYFRASFAQKAKLDGERSALKTEVVTLTKKLNEAIKNLSDSLHQSGHIKSVPEVDSQRATRYINQLKQWTDDLETYRRTVTPSSLEQQINPLHDAWKFLKDAVTSLEGGVDKHTDQRQLKSHLRPDAELIAGRTKEWLSTDNASKELKNNMSTLLSNSNKVGDRIGSQAEPTAELIRKSHEDGHLLEHLKRELEKQLEAQEKIKLSFVQFEKWKQEDAVRLLHMKERLKALHGQPRPAPPSLNIDQLLPVIRTLVIDNLHMELSVLIDQLRTASANNSSLFTSEIYKKLQPTIDLTQALYRQSQEAVNTQQA